MSNASFSTSFSVDKSPDEVFAAINNVREWWPEIDGPTDNVGAEFTHRYQDAHRCKIKVVELVAGKKVVWRVLDNYFQFTKDKTEWKDTEISFEISRTGNKTELRFAHLGLVPEYECFEVCSNAWGSLIKGSLRALIEGKGEGT
jgi:hypothetical protein